MTEEQPSLSSFREAAHKAVDYLDTGGPADLVIMSRTDWKRNAKVAGFMTGQEWFARFEKELAKQYEAATSDFSFGDSRDVLYWSYRKDILSVAKKASGIDNSNPKV